MSRVVVVGAGMAGLAVAARLAVAGHEVVVLEQGEAVGGKLGWVEQDGYGFDTGPSLLTFPQVYRDLFQATGAPLDDVLDLVELDVACHYRFAGGTEVDLPGRGDLSGRDRARTREALDDALGAGSGDQWLALLDRAAAIWDATRGPFLESPVAGARTLLALSRRRGDVRTIAPWLSLRRLGGLYLSDERLVALLDRYATYTGSDPRLAPAALATIVHVEHAYGSWYVRGGLRNLATATADRARSVGAVVRTGADVARVLVERGAVRGVVLRGGERLDADVVVAACDAAHLYGTLLRPTDDTGGRWDDDPPGGSAPGGGAARAVARACFSLRRATPSLSGFVMMLGLRGRTPGLRHHTVLFPADYDAEFDAVFGSGAHRGRPRPVQDPTVYVSAPDDPATRPDDDSEAWFVLVNAPRHTPDDPRAGINWRAAGIAEAYADHLLAVMARRGLDVRGRVVTRLVRTPADLERDTRSPGGSIYGTSSNGARSAFLRPSNTGAVRGLHLVGGSSHPGGGLPLVAMSARIVADAIGPA